MATPVSIRLPDDLRAWLDATASAEHRSLNNQIVHLLTAAKSRVAGPVVQEDSPADDTHHPTREQSEAPPQTGKVRGARRPRAKKSAVPVVETPDAAGGGWQNRMAQNAATMGCLTPKGMFCKDHGKVCNP